jgi:hypothetical protein
MTYFPATRSIGLLLATLVAAALVVGYGIEHLRFRVRNATFR